MELSANDVIPNAVARAIEALPRTTSRFSLFKRSLLSEPTRRVTDCCYFAHLQYAIMKSSTEEEDKEGGGGELADWGWSWLDIPLDHKSVSCKIPAER